MTRTEERRRGSRREQILDEALALFVEHGLHQVTTRQIALAVGISQPSLYAHFPTRDAIAIELCCRAFDALHSRLEEANSSAQSPLDRIRSLGRTYIDFGLMNGAAYRVAFMLELPGDPTVEKSRVLEAGIRAFGVLRRAYDALPLTAGQADLRAQSAWASMHGLVSLFLARPEFPFLERETLIEFHLSQICSANPSSRGHDEIC